MMPPIWMIYTHYKIYAFYLSFGMLFVPGIPISIRAYIIGRFLFSLPNLLYVLSFLYIMCWFGGTIYYCVVFIILAFVHFMHNDFAIPFIWGTYVALARHTFFFAVYILRLSVRLIVLFFYYNFFFICDMPISLGDSVN